MIVMDGKETAGMVRAEVKAEVARLAGRCGRAPGLTVLLVGDDAASQVYVRNKEKACAEAGIDSRTIRLDASETQAELEGRIDELNADPSVDGILLQLPLPRGLESQPLLERIAPHKDVDGFHPVNMGKLTLGLPGMKPCTPYGVLKMLDRYDIPTSGKNAVVVGRSNIVGKPMALMLAASAPRGNATVTVCHSRTADLAGECRRADILIAAIGRAKFITPDMVKEGAVVVDVGMNRDENGKLCGDCDFEGLKHKVSAMTPVPGGVGPMTIAMLLVNTLEAYKAHTGCE